MSVRAEITELYRSETSLVGSCNNLLLIFGLSTPERKDIDAAAAAAKTLAQKWPSGIAFLFFARAGARPPDQELRERIQNVFKQPSCRTRAMAWVVLGEGFIPAAIRSIFAAFSLGARSAYPTKVLGDVASGVSWMVDQLQGVDGARFRKELLTGEAKAVMERSGRSVSTAAR